MKAIRRKLAPKEVKIALNVFDELRLSLQTASFNTGRSMDAFDLLCRRIEEEFIGDYSIVTSMVEKGVSPRQQVYFAIANLAGDYLESGNYHIYRGTLNPMGIGNDILRLFDMSIDNLLKESAINQEEAKAQKSEIREIIKNVG